MTLAAAGSLSPHGPAAREIADLWWLMLGLGTAVFAVFLVALIVGLARRASTDRQAEAGQQRWIVGAGVLAPLVILIVVLGYTVATMRALPEAGARAALVVEVTGHQWYWQIRYPDTGVETVNDLRFPVGRPIEVRLRSADVIHSFWVPELAGKLDALPERTNTLVIQADEPAELTGRCAEFCGLDHATMNLSAVAQDPAEFEDWLLGQQAKAGPR